MAVRRAPVPGSKLVSPKIDDKLDATRSSDMAIALLLQSYSRCVKALFCVVEDRFNHSHHPFRSTLPEVNQN